LTDKGMLALTSSIKSLKILKDLYLSIEEMKTITHNTLVGITELLETLEESQLLVLIWGIMQTQRGKFKNRKTQ